MTIGELLAKPPDIYAKFGNTLSALNQPVHFDLKDEEVKRWTLESVKVWIERMPPGS